MRDSISQRPKAGEVPKGPEVVVDFEFRDGLLFVLIANPSAYPAFGVRVAFEPPFRGLGGEREIGRLALFRRLEFLAAGRRLETLVDATAAYFRRREPTKVTATVSFRDENGGRHRREIAHDLSVYRDIAYVVSQNR